MMGSSDYLQALTREITCSLCGNLYQKPHSFAGCGHCFCHVCIVNRLGQQHDCKLVCPTCDEPVVAAELYFNLKCQSIVDAVQGLQHTLSVDITDKENSHGAANAAAEPFAPKPSNSHNPDNHLSRHKEDHSSQTASGMHGVKVQVSEAAPVSEVAQHVKQSGKLHLLHNASADSKQNAVAESHRQRPKPCAPQDNQSLHMTDAEPAKSAQRGQRGAATGSEATGAATSTSSACLSWDGNNLPHPEHFPASLLQYDPAWAASVAAMPPPDGAEAVHLDVELSCIKATLEELRLHMYRKGHDIPDIQQQPEDVQDAGLADKEKGSPVSSERQQLQLSGHVMPSEVAAHSMLHGTDRSVGDIDAVMQARGYRLSCMPGPSALPQTFMSCDIEAESEDRDGSASQGGLDQPSAVPASMHHASGNIHSHNQPSPDPPSSFVQSGAICQEATAQAGTGDRARPDGCASHQQVPLAAVHQEADVVLGLPQSTNAGHEQVDLPGQNHSQPGVMDPSASASPAAHTPLPAVLADTPQAANTQGMAERSPSDTAAASVASHPVQAADQEGLVLPDSAGPTQQAPPAADPQQAGVPEAGSSPVSSQVTSGNASLEAAHALAALASGQKRPDMALAPARVPQGEPGVGVRRQRRAQQEQCGSSHMALQAVQRTAAVHRQPLKPAWQQSGRVTAGWGSKGQRTRAQKRALPQRGKKHMQQQKGTQAAEGGLQAVAGLTSRDSTLALSAQRSAGNGTTAGVLVTDACKHRQGQASSKALPGPAVQSSKHISASDAAACAAVPASRAVTNRHAKADALTDPGASRSQSPSLPPTKLSPSKATAGAAQQVANSNDDADDDDDFKPDTRRRPRAQSSPQGSSKRAKLSAEKPLAGASAQPDLFCQAIGQALLRWSPARQLWDHQIITASDATQGKFCVKGQADGVQWADVTTVQWLQPGTCPMQSLMIGQLVHQSVRIWWPDDKKHYKGTVAAFDPSNGKHHVLYDDGEEEDLDMAKEQFQFCPPLPKPEQQQQQPATSSQMKHNLSDAIKEDAELVTASAGGALLTDTAAEHHTDKHDIATSQGDSQGDNKGVQSASVNLSCTAKSCSQPQQAVSEEVHGPQPSLHVKLPLTETPEASHQSLPEAPRTAARVQDPTDSAAAHPAEAHSKPDSDPGAAAIPDRCTPQTSQPASPKPAANNAYDYAPSQAEATGSHHHQLNTKTVAQMGRSTGRGAGRKRLSVKQAAAAKRQKQVPSKEPRAGSGHKTVKQLGRPLRSRAGLAKAVSRQLTVDSDAPDNTVNDAADAAQASPPEQQLLQQQQADTSCRQSLSQEHQPAEQVGLPKSNASDNLVVAPPEQGLPQPQHAEPHVQPKLPEAAGDVPQDAGCAKDPTPQLQAAAVPAGKKVVVVGSGLDRAKLDQIRRLCRRLRADACKAVDQHTTHVVVQVNAEGLCQQRSLKYFQALAQGCWLVGWAWLEGCAAAGRWLPEEAYEVAGDQVGLGAPKAARISHQSGAQKLFHGMSFLMGFGYKGTGLSPQQLAELLTHAGGQVLDHVPAQPGSWVPKHAGNINKLCVILFGEGNVEHEEIRKTKEQTGRWPLLLSWVLDSLSHQQPLPVSHYEERGTIASDDQIGVMV